MNDPENKNNNEIKDPFAQAGNEPASESLQDVFSDKKEPEAEFPEIKDTKAPITSEDLSDVPKAAPIQEEDPFAEEAPKAEPVQAEAPEAEAPKTEAPEAEEIPKTEAPHAEAPETETPEAECGCGDDACRFEEKVKTAPKKKRPWSRFIAGCLIVSIAGGLSIGAGYGLTQNYFSSQNTVTTTPLDVQKTSKTGGVSPVDIIKAVKPSVVSISTKVVGETQYYGTFSVPFESNGMGSGVIFYSDKDKVAIATNNHVIEDASSIYATFDGDKNVPAKVAGTKSESDLAVITVSWKDLKKAGIKDVTVATFGDSSELEVGDTVIAIGNAMGMGLSATDGIISMTEQSITVDGNTLDVLQTSAAINGGNSGGALVNSRGEVIGINTAKYNSSMAEGMGYAIPSNVITPIVDELLKTGTSPQPFLGIVGTNITEETAPMYKLPVGALIMEVTENGPAANAGIQVGDVITKYGSTTVMDMESLSEAVKKSKVGQTVTVHVVRSDGSSADLKVTIGDKNE